MLRGTFVTLTLALLPFGSLPAVALPHPQADVSSPLAPSPTATAPRPAGPVVTLWEFQDPSLTDLETALDPGVTTAYVVPIGTADGGGETSYLYEQVEEIVTKVPASTTSVATGSTVSSEPFNSGTGTGTGGHFGFGFFSSVVADGENGFSSVIGNFGDGFGIFGDDEVATTLTTTNIATIVASASGFKAINAPLSLSITADMDCSMTADNAGGCVIRGFNGAGGSEASSTITATVTGTAVPFVFAISTPDTLTSASPSASEGTGPVLANPTGPLPSTTGTNSGPGQFDCVRDRMTSVVVLSSTVILSIMYLW
ncbi:hypothetical protein D9758_011705 [Tetrapyrgos nigripes]|uniref:Uncharacterized protein n=1 Tax=Tetrapyrgos nigripes TaxID=182062 RepID=A0A8H5LMI0_9AGAR|nr:hypothetical protein D9758_011705 [Tetrapyrgos nigripes]